MAYVLFQLLKWTFLGWTCQMMIGLASICQGQIHSHENWCTDIQGVLEVLMWDTMMHGQQIRRNAYFPPSSWAQLWCCKLKLSYWWWKKSCTGWYGIYIYTVICRVSYMSGGARFLPSPVVGRVSNLVYLHYCWCLKSQGQPPERCVKTP